MRTNLFRFFLPPFEFFISGVEHTLYLPKGFEVVKVLKILIRRSFSLPSIVHIFLISIHSHWEGDLVRAAKSVSWKNEGSRKVPKPCHDISISNKDWAISNDRQWSNLHIGGGCVYQGDPPSHWRERRKSFLMLVINFSSPNHSSKCLYPMFAHVRLR